MDHGLASGQAAEHNLQERPRFWQLHDAVFTGLSERGEQILAHKLDDHPFLVEVMRRYNHSSHARASSGPSMHDGVKDERQREVELRAPGCPTPFDQKTTTARKFSAFYRHRRTTGHRNSRERRSFPSA